VGLTQPPV